jgi:predicted aspartyl protease
VIVSLVLCFVAGCAAQPPGPEACNLVRLADVPVVSRDNLLFVKAGINGQWVTLLVDTGAERTVLTQAAVARLQLPHDRRVTRTMGIGGPSANWDAMLTSFVLGGLSLPVDHLPVANFKGEAGNGPPIDGLLGADVLLAYDVDLDVPEQRMALYRPRRCDDARPPWNEAARAVPGVTARRDRLFVPISLDGVRDMAVLDTGAQTTTIGPALAQRTEAHTSSAPSDQVVLAHGAAPEPVSVRLHKFRQLHIGPVMMEAPTVCVLPPDAPGVSENIVGGDFFSGRRVWLSFATRRVFVGVPDQPG